jgi:DNA-directed RNA polymerase
LLNFWEGSSLTKAGKLCLYIHGANNHNESNISKESFENRINWVKNNYLKIINLDKSLILTAEKPFIFLAFCLNMRELHNNPNAIINTPVFLDATCSGIQHLSALLLDLELGISVNLTPYNQEDGPNDIYSDLISPINKAINKYGEENYEFSGLSLVELNRKIIKTSIMTKVYNVSQYGIAKQIESKLEIKENDSAVIEQISTDLSKSLKQNKKLNIYSAPGRDNIPVYLNKKDIFKIAEIINNQIFVIFPSLNNIYSYFIETAKIMVKLGIPIT